MSMLGEWCCQVLQDHIVLFLQKLVQSSKDSQVPIKQSYCVVHFELSCRITEGNGGRWEGSVNIYISGKIAI